MARGYGSRQHFAARGLRSPQHTVPFSFLLGKKVSVIWVSWPLAPASPGEGLSLELAALQDHSRFFNRHSSRLCFFWRSLLDQKTSAGSLSAAEISHPKRQRGEQLGRGEGKTTHVPGMLGWHGNLTLSTAEWSMTGLRGLTELVILLHGAHSRDLP